MIYTLLKHLFPKLYFRFEIKSRNVWCITFDDGPNPECMDWILEQLNLYQAKATFFTLGKQLKKHPEFIDKITAQGHEIGNHSFNHLHGWKSKNRIYYQDIVQMESLYPSPIFRPPYGKMTLFQYLKLRKKYYIILWNRIANDWKTSINPEEIADKMIQNYCSGDIILLHDNLTSFENVKIILPKLLKFSIDNQIELLTISEAMKLNEY